MPKQMFYNISEEKRKTFIEAAIAEFTYKQFNEVSILSISKKAEISRGTFYNYFDNIGELFDFIFESIKKQRAQNAKQLLKKSNNNIFKFMSELFLLDFDEFKQQGRYSLFRNYIYYIRSNHKSIKQEIILPLINEISSFEDIDTTFDFTSYKYDKSEFLNTLEILIIIVIDIYISSDKENLKKEEVINKINFAVDLIEEGCKKR